MEPAMDKTNKEMSQQGASRGAKMVVDPVIPFSQLADFENLDPNATARSNHPTAAKNPPGIADLEFSKPRRISKRENHHQYDGSAAGIISERGTLSERNQHHGGEAVIPTSNHSHRRPFQELNQGGSGSRATASSPSLAPTQPVQKNQQQPVRRALLRYQEKIETLFGISTDPQMSKSYIQDCHELVNKEEDPPHLWRRVLDYASQNPIMSDSDLVRLHRRATTRLAPPASECSEQDLDHLCAIWFSYARALSRQGLEKEARLTLNHVRAWGPQKATWFLEMAKLEESSDKQQVKSILQEGIKCNDQPISEIRKAVVRLQGIPVAKKRKQEIQVVSPKRLKTESGRLDMEDSRDEDALINGVRKEPVRFRLGPLPGRLNRSLAEPPTIKHRPSVHSPHANGSIKFDGDSLLEEKIPAAVTQHSSDALDSSKLISTPSMETEEMKTGDHTSKTQTPARLEGDVSLARTRSSAGSKITRRPPLSTSTKLGKARRVDPSSMGNQDDSSDDEQRPGQTQGQQKEESNEQESVSIPKMDLSYILEWNPNKRFDEKRSNNHDSKSDSKAKTPPQLPKIDETRASDAVRNSLPPKAEQREESPKRKETPAREARSSDESLGGTSSRSSLKERAVQTFLPLVDEKNMINVNGVPYMKLGGAIGKGGSCKVYRALAKDTSVVAIKKVKLAGMNRRAIDSYANEINLLKSLRGVSSIIQMYDSEVDLQRKAIYVVMELGEVDLNYALQKQAQAGCLNMNFIRLTWQQMLTAVHCIHEVRIIHGDLKPANFLFVKGTLKLIDFGIAKAIENHDTTNIYRENQIGTLNYMSPEAILDSGAGGDKLLMKIGRASDIWSLGCILYQMVYGKTPFAELHFLPKLQAITNPRYEIQFPDSADESAIDVMKQCLQREPGLRPPIVGKNGLLNDSPFLGARKK